MRSNKTIIPALCLLAITACGNSKHGDSGTRREGLQEMQSEGTFKAILRPYNFTVAGWIPNGMADIKIVGDHVEIKSWLDDSSNVVHMQNIHFGTQCPTAANDANQDGFVDFNETVKVSGKILVPLDEDLSAHSFGGNVYPKGNFSYFQTASLSAMVNSFSRGLNLEGKVIIVTGAAANRALPTTVSAVDGQTREFSMPIACGVIEKMPEVTNN